MQNELDILKDVSSRLLRLRIPFMLTGSMAMYLYALPRMTRDIDLVIELKADELERFIAEFTTDYYVFSEDILGAVRTRRMFNIIHKDSVVKVDCILRRDQAHDVEEFARRTEVTIRDFQTFVISKEDLILAKLNWSRDSHSEIQARDIRALMRSEYDQAYVLDWAKKLGLLEWLEECSHE